MVLRGKGPGDDDEYGDPEMRTTARRLATSTGDDEEEEDVLCDEEKRMGMSTTQGHPEDL